MQNAVSVILSVQYVLQNNQFSFNPSVSFFGSRRVSQKCFDNLLIHIYMRAKLKNNGKSIFLPAMGYRWENGLYEVGSDGYYCSSSLNTDDLGTAWDFSFNSNDYYMSDEFRINGRTVRAVRSAH